MLGLAGGKGRIFPLFRRFLRLLWAGWAKNGGFLAKKLTLLQKCKKIKNLLVKNDEVC